MFRSKTQFEKVLEKATSNLLLEADFDSMLSLCDMIRGGDIKARDAVSFLKARIKDEKNPNICYFALCALDTVMKNCGDAVHEEVITPTYLEELKDMAKTSVDRVKLKILEMVQAWGIAFKDKSGYNIATNLYNVMKAEGYEFPSPTNTADMFKSEKAPVWKDGDECSKCKSDFGIVQRKHHCRACGGIFCNRCTSKQSIIPKFGIEKEVRVCDVCYNEINIKSVKTDSNVLPPEYINSALAKESQTAPSTNDQQLKEEEELQIAIAMSLNEQENSSVVKQDCPKPDVVYASIGKKNITQSPSQAPSDTAELDPELARYLNRNYWEKKGNKDEQVKEDPKFDYKGKMVSSEAIEAAEPEMSVVKNIAVAKEPQKIDESLQNGGLDMQENDDFLRSLRTSVDIFMNRMHSDQMRNRSIANDSAVQSLFQSINLMHPTLLQQMAHLEEKRLHYEALQDKLAQIRDARAALDALREEHKQKMQRAAEEAERLRQIQMAQKLEIMRQKKQEYLAYQRQIALQRLQDQEAARQARLEQQKQFIMQRAMQPAMIVQGYNTQYVPHLSNTGEALQEIPQPVSVIPGGYNPYGQSYPGQAITQPRRTHPHHYSLQTNQPGQYQQHEYSSPALALQTNQDAQLHQLPSVAPQNFDAYNMSNLASAIPEQASTHGSQVVASAPPPTPQSTPAPQQLAQSVPATQVPVMVLDNSAPRQQQLYQDQPGQDSLTASHPQQQNQSLLISFD